MHLKKRKDGRYCKEMKIKGKRISFYGQTEQEVFEKILSYRETEEKGKRFSEVADEWDTWHRNEVTETTTKRYSPCVQRAVSYFGEDYIKEITISRIDRYIKAFAEKGYYSKTVKMQLSVIKMIFKYAMLNEYITSDPCAYISVPKGLKQKHRELPDESRLECVKNGISNTFGLFAYLILYTGLRRGEALALRYEDIDFEKSVIHVTKAVRYINNRPQISSPKTQAGVRDVILLDCLAQKLQAQNAKYGYIFSDENGNLLNGSQVTRLWDKYKRETGADITPHQLRHAYATILFEAGVSDKDAQELMGHTDIQLTRNIYTHISNTRKKETANKLNSFINKTS